MEFWKEVLAIALQGGISTAAIVGAVVFVAYVVRRTVDGLAMRVEGEHKSFLSRAEQAYAANLQLLSTIDTDLRDRRIQAYRELWQKTELLPLWPRRNDVSYRDLEELSVALRDWYFRTGGMFLSTHAREVYGHLQEGIGAFADAPARDLIHATEYDALRKRCSALRTALTEDVVSRRGPPSESEKKREEEQAEQDRKKLRPFSMKSRDGRVPADDNEREAAHRIRQLHRDCMPLWDIPHEIAKDPKLAKLDRKPSIIDVRQIIRENPSPD